MNHPAMWSLAPLGPNSHHLHLDYVKNCTNLHQLDISHQPGIVENAIVYSLATGAGGVLQIDVLPKFTKSEFQLLKQIHLYFFLLISVIDSL